MGAPNAPTPTGRAAETRKKLLDAGRHAFARKAHAAVSLKRDILEPAGISVGSFYHQFDDKTDLLVAILSEHNEEMRDRFSAARQPAKATGDDPEAVALRSYGLAFDMVDEFPELIRIQFRLEGDADPRVAAFLRREEARWLESRKNDYHRIVEAFGLDVDVDFAAELVGILSEGAIRRYLNTPGPDRPAARQRLLHGLVHLTLRGLRGLSGRSAG